MTHHNHLSISIALSPTTASNLEGHTVLATVFFVLVLWNPNTREVNLIPFPSHTFDPIHQYYGFGVDPNTNDFKVVKLIINFPHHGFIISYAEVYDFSTNSWTVIHDVTLPPTNNALLQLYNGCNVLVNGGVYHWLIGYEDDFGSILCFDFRNNQFSKLMAPVKISKTETLLVNDNIVEVNGSLGYIVQHLRQARLEIWVMNEHKWTKTHSIVLPKEILILGVLKDGNQLLGRKGKQRLIIYNLIAQPVHQFPVQVCLDSPIEKYVESIVPLSA
ncbi:putative F-box/kelch-repeat protein At3g22730 [Gastrolobium bilobum]|uniref:putative F-box/kelch-repeat protein At3g22730 n=1 Tax=Gastrolobium bilobum TaxID=150636 RepID=UPI002AAFBDC3|nr:putative F-box/kelch-repeat protein At3g22730 [Gastrolobium bilobum]